MNQYVRQLVGWLFGLLVCLSLIKDWKLQFNALIGVHLFY